MLYIRGLTVLVTAIASALDVLNIERVGFEGDACRERTLFW